MSIIRTFKPYIELFRIQQYVKNLIIFLPIFFNGGFGDIRLITNCALIFILFCLLSSAFYIFNDICDIKNDKKHPEKKLRPLASGKIKIKSAYILYFALLTISGTLFLILDYKIFIFALLYFLLNLFYSLKLKHIAIIDISIIAVGFIIRIIIGALAGQAPLSLWIVLITYLLAIFLALAKRRDDFIILGCSGGRHRPRIDGYNLELINSALTIISATLLMTYIIYTTSEETMRRFGNNYIYLTVIIVIIGLLRYLQLTLVQQKSGSPTKIILKDSYIQLCVLSWLSAFTIIIYIK